MFLALVVFWYNQQKPRKIEACDINGPDCNIWEGARCIWFWKASAAHAYKMMNIDWLFKQRDLDTTATQSECDYGREQY